MPEKRQSRRLPAATPQAREDELINLAVDLSERQMREGTVSAQVQTHFLKMSSSREKLEQQRLQGEIELMQIKKDTLAAEARIEEKMNRVIKALKSYTGQDDDEEDDDDDY